jgi:hypothetical protein
MVDNARHEAMKCSGKAEQASNANERKATEVKIGALKDRIKGAEDTIAKNRILLRGAKAALGDYPKDSDDRVSLLRGIDRIRTENSEKKASIKTLKGKLKVYESDLKTHLAAYKQAITNEIGRPAFSLMVEPARQGVADAVAIFDHFTQKLDSIANRYGEDLVKDARSRLAKGEKSAAALKTTLDSFK